MADETNPVGDLGSSEPQMYRGATEIKIQYKDVTGLVEQMNNLAASLKKVNTELAGLNQGDAKQGLENIKAILGGGGGVKGFLAGIFGGVKFGQPVKTAATVPDADEGQAQPQEQVTQRGNGGSLAHKFAMAGIGVAATVGFMYARRSDENLASDAASVRMTYTSDKPTFGLTEANRYTTQALGPAAISRADIHQAAGALTGRYGMAQSADTNQAMAMAGAYGSASMQGVGFGADIVNALNRPEVLNRVRMHGGGTRAQWGSAVGSARTMGELAFSGKPTMAQLSEFRPGTMQYENMMYLAGGDAAAATMQVELLKMEQAYNVKTTKPFGEFKDSTIRKIYEDEELQRQMFGGERSLIMSKQKLESGKVMTDEEALDLARSGLVDTNEYLASIQQNTEGLYKEFQKWAQPAGNFLEEISGGISNILGPLADIAILTGALKGGGGPISAIGGLAASGGRAVAGRLAGGGALATVGRLAGGAGVGALAGQGIDSLIGNPKDKEGVDVGNILRYGAMGAGGGLMAGGGVFSLPGAAIGGAGGLAFGLGKELLFGDPVGPRGRAGAIHGVGVGDPVDSMSVSDADALLRSRANVPSQVAGLQADFKIRLGRLFRKNPRLSLTSGARSRAEQENIYRDRYRPPYPGAPLDADGWVHVKGAAAAKPGRSNHEYGLAADIGPDSQYGWLASNAPKEGLNLPMPGSEPWHWQPPGVTSGSYKGAPAAGAGGADVGAEAVEEEPKGGGGGVSGGARTARSGIGATTQGGPGTAGQAGVSVGGSAGGGTSVGAAADAGGAGPAQPWAGGGGAITMNQAADFLRKAGIRSDQIATGVAVGIAESGLRAGAHNPNAGTGDNSYGIWQINMLGSMGPERRRQFGISSNEELFNPAVNAKAANMLSGGGSNWTPWTTYKHGKHEQYMGQVQSALSSGVGDPVGASASPAMPMLSVGGGGGGVQVRAPINIQVMSASEDEAVRLAKVVATHIQGVVGSVTAAREGL